MSGARGLLLRRTLGLVGLLALRPPLPCLAWVGGGIGGGSRLVRRQQLQWPPQHRHHQQQQQQQHASLHVSPVVLGARARKTEGDASSVSGDGKAEGDATTKTRRGKSSTSSGGTKTTTKKATTSRKTAAAKVQEQHQPDPRWREQLEGIRRMREEGPEAPVDYAGCAELGLRNATSERHMRFQTLISSMMSSQTTDIVNEAAMRRLHETCPGGITIEGLEALGEEGIARTIKPVSFYTPKAQNILKVCAILKTKYDGDIPRTFEELMELPGIGPKMATLIMAYAWGEVVGITVDTHVHRISNRLGWVDTWNHKNPRAQNPEKTRKALESWLPREHWKEVNPLMVGLGQTVCRAIGPKCHECQITHLCPSYLPPETCR